jgi:hypothetical protein
MLSITAEPNPSSTIKPIMLIRLSPNVANKVSVSVLRRCVAAALPVLGLLDKDEHSY